MDPQSWTSTADDYAQFAQSATLQYAKKAVELADIQSKSGMKILDVACGAGVVPEVVVQKVPVQTEILATDYAQGMVDIVQKKAETERWNNVKTKVMDATALELPDSSYDVVFCVFGLMYFPTPAKALSEFHRVLTPGGVTVFTTWATQEINPLIITAVSRAKGTEGMEIPFLRGWGDLEFCKEQLEAAGFREIKAIQHFDKFAPSNLDGFIGSIARNPVMRSAFLKGFSDDEIAKFQDCLKVVIIEKYGKRDMYEFGAVANVTLGVK
ncbi:hypothetical protein Unana1_05609 [Umbelopsis nana]